MKNLINTAINRQKSFFKNRNTFDISKRKYLLKKLRDEIRLNEKEIETALFNDLGKSEGESYLTEIHFVYSELKIAINNIDKWTKRKSIRSSLACS